MYAKKCTCPLLPPPHNLSTLPESTPHPSKSFFIFRLPPFYVNFMIRLKFQLDSATCTTNYTPRNITATFLDVFFLHEALSLIIKFYIVLQVIQVSFSENTLCFQEFQISNSQFPRISIKFLNLVPTESCYTDYLRSIMKPLKKNRFRFSKL